MLSPLNLHESVLHSRLLKINRVYLAGSYVPLFHSYLIAFSSFVHSWFS